jgi:GTP-binding protein
MDDSFTEAPQSHVIRQATATVAILGRPNVGKSALFNRLVGRRLAIVEDMPGVTRDRLYARAEWQGRIFSFIDTGGIDTATAEHDELWANTREQAEIAARAADLIVFVVDGSEGLNPLDEEVAAIIRKMRRPVVFVANKLESEKARNNAIAEFAPLGFGPPNAVSAIHGEGTGDLLDLIVEKLPPQEELEDSDDVLALAVVGRPNVGKSSLVNALIGEERSIVSDMPGTTRDAIDTLFQYQQQRIRLVDTAGVWRKSRSHGDIEYYASLRSYKALERADIVILVIDSMEGVMAQDRRLAGAVLEAGAALIIVANKWDLARELGEFQQNELIDVIHQQMPFAHFAPVTFLSALTKRRLGSLMPLVMRVAENRKRRISTSKVNSLIREATLAHPPPNVSGRSARIYYASQVATAPPRFLFSCNDPDRIANSYRRFLENTLRTADDFEGVPLDMEFRTRRVEEDSAST